MIKPVLSVLLANYTELKDFFVKIWPNFDIENDLTRAEFDEFSGVVHDIGWSDKDGCSSENAHWYPIFLGMVPKKTKISKRCPLYTSSNTLIHFAQFGPKLFQQ